MINHTAARAILRGIYGPVSGVNLIAKVVKGRASCIQRQARTRYEESAFHNVIY